MMRWADTRDVVGAPDQEYVPTPLTGMAPFLPEIVILAEDSRFRTHWGIDPAALRDALGIAPRTGPVETLQALWRRRHRIRGASTIPQQLAKNFYLSPSRNPLRKIKEAVTALRLDAALPKDRILALYLNTVELGPGIWGVQAASHAYFAVGADALTVEQAASLAATLPHPRTSNPAYRPARMLARRRLILARYAGSDVAIPPADGLDGDSLPWPPFTPPIVPPGLDTISVTLPIPGVTPPATDTTRHIPE